MPLVVAELIIKTTDKANVKKLRTKAQVFATGLSDISLRTVKLESAANNFSNCVSWSLTTSLVHLGARFRIVNAAARRTFVSEDWTAIFKVYEIESQNEVVSLK